MPPKKRSTATKGDSSNVIPPVSMSVSDQVKTAPSLPIQHHIPRVALQLAAIGFCMYSASSLIHSGDLQGQSSTVVDALVQDPIRFLATVNASLLAVQTWFGLWTRSQRLLHGAKQSGSAAQATNKPKPAQPKKGFTGSVKAMVDRAWKGELPHTHALNVAREAHSSGKLDFGLDAIPRALATALVFALFFHACAILLGAPLLANAPATFLLACLVSILAIVPLALTSPLTSGNKYTWLRLFSALTINDQLEFALMAPALGAIIGCWLGAVPIPLDWDRPWQAWPTTCVLGTIAGHAIGSLTGLAGSVFWSGNSGKRL